MTALTSAMRRSSSASACASCWRRPSCVVASRWRCISVRASFNDCSDWIARRCSGLRACLPLLLERLDEGGAEGCDAVVGYRVRRRDTFVRRASSRIANGIRNWISRDDIRDTGCSLKVFRAEALRTIPWFDGMHRFLPTLLRYHGFSVIEHPVGHGPRLAGKSKYGVANRAWRAFKDLIAVRWMRGRRLLLPIREVTDGR